MQLLVPCTRTPDLEQTAQLHRQLAADWERLLNQAREIPGFRDFMRPRQAADLMHAARTGPVVVINVHLERCDALIIQPDSSEITRMPLENISEDKAINVRTQFAPLIGRQGVRSDARHIKNRQIQSGQSFISILAILWSDVVKPILSFLGYMSNPPTNELPHITWCTTGALSFLPLHAAGCYDGSRSNVFQFVVSSYTPTLGALFTSNSAPGTPTGLLAIGQESIQGLSHLPCTRLELAAIQEYAKETHYLQLEDENATVDAVLHAMDEYSWVHLACHATQQTDDPAQSAFHLHDGSLMLSAITKKSFKGKGLAFLSACQTATGSKEVLDEAVHLAAGMLMVGYPSVIATIWAIQDENAPEVARDVYAELLKDGKMDCTKASRALHKAVGCLRDKVGERSYERWVPFVHIGI